MSDSSCYYYDSDHNCCLCYDNQSLDNLLAENTKLRKLVRISIEHCNSGTCDGCPIQGDDGSCPYTKMAFELGVEVK